MANSRRRVSEVNAGSMADIAFLLLIFFLVVSTIEDDVGINRKLPKICQTNDCIVDIPQRNLLTIRIGQNQTLMVNDVSLPLSSLKQEVTDFLSNNGDASCSYCHGKKLMTSSDNPKVAVISVLSARESRYEWFIKVQDVLVATYFDLRMDYARTTFNKPLSKLTAAELKLAKEAYPFRVSEADLKL